MIEKKFGIFLRWMETVTQEFEEVAEFIGWESGFHAGRLHEKPVPEFIETREEDGQREGRSHGQGMSAVQQSTGDGLAEMSESDESKLHVIVFLHFPMFGWGIWRGRRALLSGPRAIGIPRS